MTATRAPTHAILAWRKPRTDRVTYDPSTPSGFPAGSRIVSYRRPSWSDDGRTVFVGIGQWDEKVPGTATPKDGDRGREAGEKHGDKDAAKEPDEPAAVEVWHATRRRRHAAPEDQRENRSSAQHARGVARRRQPVRPARHGPRRARDAAPPSAAGLRRQLGAVRDGAHDRTAVADVYLVDIETGARTKVKDGIDDQYLQASPGGRYLLYLQADQYWTIDTATRATVNISKAASRHPSSTASPTRRSSRSRRSASPAGRRTTRRCSLYDKFDVWRVAADGTRRHAPDRRRDRADPPSLRPARSGRGMDRSRGSRSTSRCSASGRKQSGYARLDPGCRRLDSRWCSGQERQRARQGRRTPTSTPTSSRRSTIRRT